MTNGASRGGVHLFSDFLRASSRFAGGNIWGRLGIGVLGYLLIDDITGGDNTLLSAGLAAVLSYMSPALLGKGADLAETGENYLFNGPKPLLSMRGTQP